MKQTLFKALGYNVIGLFILSALYLLKYDINRTHTKDIFIIMIMAESFYWLTVSIGLFVVKKLKR